MKSSYCVLASGTFKNLNTSSYECWGFVLVFKYQNRQDRVIQLLDTDFSPLFFVSNSKPVFLPIPKG